MAPSARPHWSLATVAGHPCEMFSPPGVGPGRAIVYLHDLDCGPLSAAGALADAIEAAAIPVIAPLTGRSWWLDRAIPGFDPNVSPERFVRESIVAEIAARFDVRPPGIALVGIGMGGQGALRLAYRHPSVFPIAAAIAPTIDFHLGMRHAADRDDGHLFDTLWETFGDVERARQDTAILHVHPLNWPRHQWFASDRGTDWHDGAERLHGKLAALGIPHEAVLETRRDEDRNLTARRQADAALSFVVHALDAESRRIA